MKPDPAGAHSHFADVFRWAGPTRFGRRRVLLSLCATALPLAASRWAGHPALGYATALGAVLMSGESPKGAGQCSSPALALAPAILAILAALLIARLPGAEMITIALAAGAAALVNYSRPAAVAGIRFTVLLLLNLSLVGPHGSHGGAALAFGIGAIWRVLLHTLARRRADAVTPALTGQAARAATPRQRRIHLRRMLATLAGWQYPLRLAAGLAAACLMRDRWPSHHFDWIVLSIALMTPHALEHLPVHITQRAIGTLGGVALAGTVVVFAPPPGALALLVCLLGTLAPLARSGNYAAYCLCSTPLILLAMDANATIDRALLADRLLATLASAAIVVAANLLMDGALRLCARRR